ncbi:MAG: hypothetical protein ACREJO_16155 [Phycisphaerales bacterium]
MSIDTSAESCRLCEAAASVAGVPPAPAEVEGNRLVSFFARLFDTEGFPPRWRCGTWEPEVGWLHICADIAIFGAYAAIPATLLYFILRRRDVPMRGIFWLFAAFIVSCGLTHLVDATMFYTPMYRFLGVMKVITAVISIVTVVALARVLPEALRLPGLAQSHERMRVALAERERAEEKARVLSEQLEVRNAMLTVRSRRVAEAMSLARVGAIRWNTLTGHVEWEVGVREALAEGGEALPFDSWEDVLTGSTLVKLLREGMDCARNNRPLSIELPLRSDKGPARIARISAAPERPLDDDAPALMGVVRVITEEGSGLPGGGGTLS